ncbi:hypothetical protein BV25DRAFT_1818784 [Artomyces pyxidatus]|uniref:Uncharacterized protein n=1 Tax=Artomyces pyxidatus TaxID=48021 RepID=A0ACB8TJ05_9AGAM|nr:hypothetical protein BV25DRAFT_1818784 [Artomyces pyxidatus]
MADTRSNNFKRRLTSPADLGFFTPSATSFQPRPYNPNSAAQLPKPPPPARNHSLTHPLPPMDPSPSDPGAIFIRPPFTTFPGSHLYPEGLTYSLMAANPDWFLTASDFLSTQASLPDAVPYPSQLEPPRGWCPAKKKDLKERGADGWPEGEEPRLRCTFCRRTYAGVNAKSMWRRHVFEKHKIAMANRRDNMERSRKGAGTRETKDRQEKENFSGPARNSRSSTAAGNKSKLRSLRPAAGTSASAFFDRGNGHDESADDEEEIPIPSAPRIPQEEFSVLEPSPELSRPPLSQSSSRTSPTPPPDSPQSDSPEFVATPVLDEGPPTPARLIIPASPYDPLTTPSFRHSPPRLPSDQPWRFPSPSHPLHSMARELSLSMLVSGQATPPSAKTPAAPSAIDVSPVIIAPQTGKASVFSTPSVVLFGKRKEVGSDTTFSAKGHSSNATKPTPRRLFLSGSLPAPVTDRLSYKRYRPVEESPLRRDNAFTPRASKSSSDFSLDTPIRPRIDRIDSGLLESAVTLGEDPFFNLYGSLAEFHKKVPEIVTPPLSSPGIESPVIRTRKYSDHGLSNSRSRMLSSGMIGLGLMEPFSLKQDLEDDGEDNGEIEEMLMSSPVARSRLSNTRSTARLELASPDEDDSESMDDHPPMRKRRRTIAGKD